MSFILNMLKDVVCFVCINVQFTKNMKEVNDPNFAEKNSRSVGKTFKQNACYG